MNLITFKNERVRGRDEGKIWRLTKLLRWHRVDLTLDDIMGAGGKLYDATHPAMFDVVFQTGDAGIARLKAWCYENCKSGWRYEPATTFIFRKISDALLFKLTWAGA